MNKNNFVRLPLKKAYNVRDLGGYPNINGNMTKWHTYLRADDMCNLESDDIEFLLDYGVNAIVDLRSKNEIEKKPNPFSKNPKVSYINIPLMVDVVDDVTKFSTTKPEEFIPNFYMQLIQNSTIAIKTIFEFFSKEENTGILFHCAVGKDRTGITSMLLLGLANVNKYDIISNYEVTYSNLRQNSLLLSPSNGYPTEVMYSKSDYIEGVIDYILNTFGSFEKYLLSIGLTQEVLTLVYNKFI